MQVVPTIQEERPKESVCIGCSSMGLESVKTMSSPSHRKMQWEPSMSKQDHHQWEGLVQMKMIYNTAFYLVSVECPFQEFPALLGLQRKNSVPLGQSYSNPKQARNFVHCIAEEIRSGFVLLARDADFFSICMDSSKTRPLLMRRWCRLGC